MNITLNNLGIEMAEYLADNEEEDFQDWCFSEELVNKIEDVHLLTEEHDRHIFFTAKLFLHLSGQDIKPYSFHPEVLK